jgi:signal peptidase I
LNSSEEAGVRGQEAGDPPLDPEELPAPATEPWTSDATAPTSRTRSGPKSAVRDFLETAVLALIIFVAVRSVVMNYRVIGHSMEPNIHEAQYLLIDKLLYGWAQPRRGDIVVLRPPDVVGEVYLKRVIGLPGETVEVREGRVYVDDGPIQEPWATKPFPESNWGPAKVGANELFVLGDNRPGSRDSRYFGMLTRDRIIGRSFLCYWPPSEWTVYPRYAPVAYSAAP